MMPAEAPSPLDDLQLKACDTLEWLTRAQDRGDISPAQYETGVQTLFMAVSGMLDNEMMEIISEAKPSDPPPNWERHVLLRKPASGAGRKVVIVSRKIGGERVTIADLDVGDGGFKKVDCEDSRAAKRKIEAVIAALKTKGYARI